MKRLAAIGAILCPILCVIAVLIVDHLASIDRENAALDNAGNFCEIIFLAAAEAYADGGPDALPIREQTIFTSLDIYSARKDGTFVVNPRFWENAVKDELRIQTVAYNNAIAGNSDIRIIDDYRGYQVISAYGPVEWKGERHALMVEIDVEEVQLGVSHWWYRVTEGIVAFFSLATIICLIVSYDKKSIVAVESMVIHGGEELAHLKEILRRMPDIMVVLDHELLVRYVSLAAADAFGQMELSIVGRPIKEFLPELNTAIVDFVNSHEDNIWLDINYRNEDCSLRLQKVISGDERFIIGSARPLIQND